MNRQKVEGLAFGLIIVSLSLIALETGVITTAIQWLLVSSFSGIEGFFIL
jgi:hypothetical protein